MYSVVAQLMQKNIHGATQLLKIGERPRLISIVRGEEVVIALLLKSGVKTLKRVSIEAKTVMPINGLMLVVRKRL